MRKGLFLPLGAFCTSMLATPAVQAGLLDRCNPGSWNFGKKEPGGAVAGAMNAPHKSAIDFTIPASQLAEAERTLKRDVLNTTYFVLPKNDGEAVRAVEILQAAKAPHVKVSSQGWGALLEKEGLPSPAELKAKGVKRIAVFEMPGEAVEKTYRDAGIDVTIIDHHSYPGLGIKDRVNPKSSLEQLMELIRWPASRVDQALAVNDRSYIPGLKAMGLSPEEISEVRKYDLMAQGRTADQVEKMVRDARAVIPRLPQENGIYVLGKEAEGQDKGILKQELAILSPSGIVSSLEVGGGKIGFSGDPAVAKALLDFPFEKVGYTNGKFDQYGGGDPTASMFFGFKPHTPPTGSNEAIPPNVLEEIWKTIRAAQGAKPAMKKSPVAATGLAIDSAVKAAGMLPRGAAIATSAGELEKTGIKHIIHAASGSMTRGGGVFEPTKQGVIDSVKNSMALAHQLGAKRVAVPFIGGKIFVQRIGIPAQELADGIVDAAIKNSNGLEVRFMTFGPEDTALFQRSVAKHPGAAAAVIDGSITDFRTHGASVIVNAANMEAQFGGGLSGVIARATGRANEIDAEARKAIKAFYEQQR